MYCETWKTVLRDWEKMAKTEMAEKTLEAVWRARVSERRGEWGQFALDSLCGTGGKRQTRFPFWTTAKQAKVMTMTRRGSVSVMGEDSVKKSALCVDRCPCLF